MPLSIEGQPPRRYTPGRETSVLSAVGLGFALDGVPRETQRTAVKRLAHPDPEFRDEAFAVGFEAFLPPGALSVGDHEMTTFVQDPVFGDFDLTVGFTVASC